ncbi:GlxA family transcriptional regulator [Amycolatopsis sp. NPDC051903]|uniref:GlxA family transcriptional regulator n=1 Tax=Amycolatopsis sp. NPDC051903 TaxID=3363936 RepID=UPI00378DA26E
MSVPRRSVPVAVLVFDGVRLLDVTGPLEVFDVAAELGTGYEVTVCSPDGRDITTSSGLRLGVERSAAEVYGVDTLLVPGGECLVKPGADDELLTAIQLLARGARRVTSVCAGAFALGAAGLLDGRRATTHWRHADTLQDRYPSVDVDAEAIYVRDGRVLTSAGVSSGIDLALALVEEDAGDILAHEIARELVVFMRRRGAQPQLSVPARTPRPRRDVVRTLCDEVAADPAGDHCLTSMAQRAGLSTRHLSRLFKQGTGQTPATYVAAVRREAAIALVDSGETIAAAARRSGLGSDETLRRHLRAQRDGED